MNTLVVGAGIAGVSAATWLRSLHLRCDWVASSFGGTLQTVYNAIDNYPPHLYANGAALTARLDDYCRALHLSPRMASVSAITAHDGALHVTVDQLPTPYDAVILATGTAPRTWTVPGVQTIQTRLRGSSTRHPTEFAGSSVAVVGGGDGAAEAALRLSAHCHVHLIARSSLRARPDYTDQVRAHPNITVSENCPISHVADTPDGCRLFTDLGPRDVAAVYLKIGFAPQYPTLPEGTLTDAEGFVVTNPQGLTSISGLLAAGDVTHCALRSVATSAADGARCARTIADLYESITSSTR